MNVWEKVYLASGQGIVKFSPTPFDMDILLSIVGSAPGVAERVYKIHEDYFRQLGEVTFQRVLPFVGVFAMAMTSRWVRQVCDQDPSVDRMETWARLVTVILQVFGDASQERYEETWLLDVQFNHDRSLAEQGKGLASWHEQWLLLCVAARALGAQFRWKLSSPPIPFASFWDLYHMAPAFDPPAGLNLLNFSRMVEVDVELLAAEAGMYAAFKALQQERRRK